MSLDARKLYESSNGDTWHLVRNSDNGDLYVRHTANAPSGGFVRDVGLGVFLTLGDNGPERQELWRLIGTLVDSSLESD